MDSVGGRGRRKKRLKDDVERRNLLVVARDLGRFASELESVGESGFEIRIRAPGWLGRWLRFEGFVKDLRPPILWDEVLEMLDLYRLEKEEQDEARRERDNSGD